jgi:hypothetical protein
MLSTAIHQTTDVVETKFRSELGCAAIKGWKRAIRYATALFECPP